jgi:hypothetical protein
MRPLQRGRATRKCGRTCRQTLWWSCEVGVGCVEADIRCSAVRRLAIPNALFAVDHVYETDRYCTRLDLQPNNRDVIPMALFPPWIRLLLNSQPPLLY